MWRILWKNPRKFSKKSNRQYKLKVSVRNSTKGKNVNTYCYIVQFLELFDFFCFFFFNRITLVQSESPKGNQHSPTVCWSIIFLPPMKRPNIFIFFYMRKCRKNIKKKISFFIWQNCFQLTNDELWGILPLIAINRWRHMVQIQSPKQNR